MSGTQESTAAPRGLRLTAAFALASALTPLGSTMLAVVSPQIAESFGVDATTLTPWLVMSYLAIAIVGQGPGGRLGDAMGHARALAAGQACCALGALAGALAPHVAVVVAARVLMAAGGAVMLPAAMAMLHDTTRPERRARAFGWFGAIMSLAAAIGPLLGGEIAARFGWRATFTAQLVPLLLSALLARGATLGTRALAETERRTETDGARGGVSLLALFRVRSFASGSIVTALQNCAMYGVLHQVPLLFGTLLGEEEPPIGRALVVMMAAMVVLSPLGGLLAERFGARAVVLSGSLLSTSGVLLLVDVSALHHASDAWLGLTLLGAGVGLTSGPAQASALSEVPGKASGYAAGLLSTTRYVGGVAAMALLLPLRPGHGDVSSALALHSYVFVAFACAAALAGVMALALPGRPRRAMA